MIELLAALAAVLICGLLALIWALRSDPQQETGAVDSNAAVFAQRLDELRKERERGALDDDSFAQLETDLQRQLLAEEKAVGERGLDKRGLGRGLQAGLVMLVLLVSVLLYRQIGAWPDWQFHRLQQAFANQERFSEADMERLGQAIETSLRFGPDQHDLRFWQAQLAVEQGDFSKAVASYRQLLAAQPNSALVMAHLAQALFLQNDRRLNDESRALMRRAVEIDPSQTTALGMLGIDAFERQDYQAAIDHWSQLLRLLDPGAPQAQIISNALDRAREQASAEGVIEGIRVRVSQGDIDLPARGVLYVFARAADGPAFPLAVLRKPQHGEQSWPQSFLLTPEDAMRPEMTLREHDEVVVTARYSLSGSVTPATGDVEGRSAVLRWRELEQPLELVLDTRIP